MSQTIVVGFDGSACAEQALQKAIWIGKGFEDGRLIIVYGHSIGTGAVWRSQPDLAEIAREKEHIRVAAAEFLDEAVNRVRESGLQVESVVRWESPADALLEVAREDDAVLIVVGSHGAGSTLSRLLGHVPHKLLHHSPVPLLVVPDGRES